MADLENEEVIEGPKVSRLPVSHYRSQRLIGMTMYAHQSHELDTSIACG